MTLYLCIDDTDQIGTKGTGELAEELATRIQQLGLGECSAVTRHQLYVHESIPYTSHNSAMCFSISQPGPLAAIRELAIDHLNRESAAGSDPGLCLFQGEDGACRRALVDFGCRAKREVLTKEQAYEMAERCGALLSEHGGTGDGIIGALAGLGLRLGGSDGRFKGQFEAPGEGERFTVAQLLRETSLDQVLSLSHEPLSPTEQVNLEGKLKAVLLNHRMTLLVSRDDQRWVNAQKRHLHSY
ncbi:DNA-binding protein [Ferrimonas futtsuensis]|uniref:DNA-binding protein n=1 Tax=Ferrimonas futtsuensis TaxID=364764 RepID=UPI000404B822|nr:DNA-binding protein [Ferrimonas futtsuensis]